MNDLAKIVGELKRVTGGSLTVGWTCDEVDFLLYSLIKFFRPSLVLQTGHLWGKSACFILEALSTDLVIEEDTQHGDLAFREFLEQHAPPLPLSPRLFSIDPDPAGVPDSPAGIQFLHDHYPGFEFFQMTSEEFFRTHEVKGERVLAFIDGNHSAYGVLTDLNGVHRMSPVAIVLDDTICQWLPEINAVAQEFADSHGYQILTLPWYNGVTLLVPGVGGENACNNSCHWHRVNQ